MINVQIITDVKRDIDSNTFQPIIKFSGQLSNELIQDIKVIMSEDEMYQFLGSNIVNEIFNKLNLKEK